MHLSLRTCLTFAAAGAVLILVALLVSTLLVVPDRSEKLFARFVVDPVPQSVRVFDSEYVPGREWRAFFHIQLLPQDFPAILRAKQYKRLEDNSTGYRAFLETTYQHFRKRLPGEVALPSYEIYELWSDSEGTVSYLISNREHSELFVFSVRQ